MKRVSSRSADIKQAGTPVSLVFIAPGEAGAKETDRLNALQNSREEEGANASAAGFSLLELTVTLLIVSFLLATGISASHSKRLKPTVKSLQLRLQEAQLRASENHPIKVSTTCRDKETFCLYSPAGNVVTTPTPLRFFSPVLVSPASVLLTIAQDQCTLTLSLRGKITPRFCRES